MLLFRIYGKEAGYHISKNLHSESDCFDSELSTHLIYNIKISSLPMRCLGFSSKLQISILDSMPTFYLLDGVSGRFLDNNQGLFLS